MAAPARTDGALDQQYGSLRIATSQMRALLFILMVGHGLAQLAASLRMGTHGDAQRAVLVVECSEGMSCSGVSKWPAGAWWRWQRAECMAVALRPFALVTFIWASK
jgi:hypothetical protein